MDTDEVEKVWNSDEHRIRSLLMGRRIVSADGDMLMLDNGTLIRVIPVNNVACCTVVSNTLDFVAAYDNVITRVNVVAKELDIKGENPRSYKIFVYSSKIKGKGKTAILSVTGDQGNFRYGSGYDLEVMEA